MYVTGTIIIIALLMAAILLLRLRIRFELGNGRRRLFVGLGRSGPQFDFVRRVQSIKLFGFTIWSSPMKDSDDSEETETVSDVKKKSKRKKAGRVRSIREILAAVPAISGAMWRYSIGLLKSIIVEELEAEIQAGFEAVDLTGQVFGYYQAALAAAPTVMGRIQYRPDWTGPSFAGQARVCVALPVYRMVFCTLKLIYQLPLRRIVKLAIGKKRGGQDGRQQRS
ncbi:MAG: hypothetical protein OEV49_15950 [candidate division Zixibacteria bacterium]|nr:hypothetical protein [candidate division Zixibacteria bacterium]MDH3936691.1 hypothetical protein [candidate division Zixibacteria bacterium]MDH4034140.1 hypothetical protein [candidate division Zixibacteria bacterium]